MTNFLMAMGAALAMRDACRRQIEYGRSIDNLNVDAIVSRAIQEASGRLDCPDDAFENMARVIQVQNRCSTADAFRLAWCLLDPSRPFGYSRWRHGGWYVSGVRYPSGACGCVSRNYPDRKWRIVCDDRRQEMNGPGDATFGSCDEAARAEQTLALDAWKAAVPSPA
ncbi:hypothetical protein [Paracidovorax anthurii]|uniref:Uncharacterized protein n=1 Tax=Paracidovorax anthurii TaxID=78229 RepID=A0A328Z559_9BURK|nr:hypothetical protein [Paracidovorax anthurii]RAR81019.1 hypothetical protein AX018_102135 [Paracidovorax anthurii]